MAEDQEFVLPPLEERPLVTFALFAYNQEEYIREAIEGAFAQTYEPLEIILSDDFSTDRTFEIMQAMASRYCGPHRVQVRRNPENLGILKNVINAIRGARGDFIVLAAGDDISRPSRTSRLIEMWLCGYDGVYSNYDLIDSKSNLISSNRRPKGGATIRLPWLKKIKNSHFVYGSTSSYSKKIINSLIEPQKKVQSEDTALNTVLHLHGGKACHIDEALVAYRLHGNTLSSSSKVPTTIGQIIKHEIGEQQKAERQHTLMLYIRDLLLKIQSKNISSILIDLNSVEKEIEFSFLKSNWKNLSVTDRLTLLLSTKSSTAFKWAIFRISGIHVYAFLKWIHRMVFRSSYDEVK